MMIKSAVILANAQKENIKNVSSKVRNYLESKSIKVYEFFLSGSGADSDIEIPKVDVAVSLGGDGTVLTCARLLKNSNIPLLAVKLGTFGYITETSTDEFEEVFEKFINGKNEVENRMMINAAVIRDGKEIFSYDALNEITVSSKEFSKLLRLNLYINDVFAANLRSDGILFSTPTGSTAYNLSAGGPILDADLSAIIINPICPFAMSVRPLVVKDNSVIRISVPTQNTKSVIIYDGHEVFPVLGGDEIIVKKSSSFTKMIRNKERNRIEILRDKLGWAGGFND